MLLTVNSNIPNLVVTQYRCGRKCSNRLCTLCLK